MEKQAVSGIMLTLLVTCMLTLAFNIQAVKAEPKTWTVDDDGPADFSSIQEAINSLDVKDGDTIHVYNGTYYEHVVVNKTVSLIGQNRSTTLIDGNGKGTVVYVTASNVGISGFTMQNARAKYAGIHLADDANSNTISDNTMINNEVGILIWSSGNTITENRIKKNRYGMYLMRCSNNVLSSNNISENIYNFWVGGYLLSDYIHNIDTSNLVNDKPVYYFVNQRNLVVDPSTFPEIGYLGLVNSTDIVVKNLSIAKNAQGVLFAYTTSSTIMNINASNNDRGIYLFHSSDNIIIRNTLRDNIDGVTSLHSDDNNISSNTMSSNRACGIGLISSSSNTIIGNNVSENGGGIQIASSNNNILYHNNFVSNTNQVLSLASTNQWNDGYPSGGNYWSDYTITYPDAKELDDSGIWDTPYIIDENNIDRYPLMSPWTRICGNLQILEPIDGSVIMGSATITFVIENTGEDVEFLKGDPTNRIDLEIEYSSTEGEYGWAIMFWSTSYYGLTLSSGEKYELTLVYDPSEYEGSVPPDFVGEAPFGEAIIRLVHWKSLELGSYSIGEFGKEEIQVTFLPPAVTANIDFNPDSFNLKSKRRWITVFIELPEGYNVSDIDISTVRLNGEIPAELHPAEIGDYDKDGIPDLMVKFSGASVVELLSISETTITITGEAKGTPFQGTDTIARARCDRFGFKHIHKR